MSRTIEQFSPADRTIAAKVPRPVEDRLREAARAADRTLSGQVRRVLREWAESEQPGRREAVGIKLQWRVLRSDLPSHLKPLALVLALMAKDDGGTLFPRVETLAAYLGRNRVTISNWLAELRELGVLVTERRSGRKRATLRRLVVEALSELRSPYATQSLDQLRSAYATQSADDVAPGLREGADYVAPGLPVKQVLGTKTIYEERKHPLTGARESANRSACESSSDVVVDVDGGFIEDVVSFEPGGAKRR